MTDTDRYEEEPEGEFITITGVVTELYFEELMDGRESFHDVEWDIEKGNIWEFIDESLLEEVKQLREWENRIRTYFGDEEMMGFYDWMREKYGDEDGE